MDHQGIIRFFRADRFLGITAFSFPVSGLVGVRLAYFVLLSFVMWDSFFLSQERHSSFSI